MFSITIVTAESPLINIFEERNLNDVWRNLLNLEPRRKSVKINKILITNIATLLLLSCQKSCAGGEFWPSLIHEHQCSSQNGPGLSSRNLAHTFRPFIHTKSLSILILVTMLPVYVSGLAVRRSAGQHGRLLSSGCRFDSHGGLTPVGIEPAPRGNRTGNNRNLTNGILQDCPCNSAVVIFPSQMFAVMVKLQVVNFDSQILWIPESRSRMLTRVHEFPNRRRTQPYLLMYIAFPPIHIWRSNKYTNFMPSIFLPFEYHQHNVFESCRRNSCPASRSCHAKIELKIAIFKSHSKLLGDVVHTQLLWFCGLASRQDACEQSSTSSLCSCTWVSWRVLSTSWRFRNFFEFVKTLKVNWFWAYFDQKFETIEILTLCCDDVC